MSINIYIYIYINIYIYKYIYTTVLHIYIYMYIYIQQLTRFRYFEEHDMRELYIWCLINLFRAIDPHL